MFAPKIFFSFLGTFQVSRVAVSMEGENSCLEGRGRSLWAFSSESPLSFPLPRDAFSPAGYSCTHAEGRLPNTTRGTFFKEGTQVQKKVTEPEGKGRLPGELTAAEGASLLFCACVHSCERTTTKMDGFCAFTGNKGSHPQPPPFLLFPFLGRRVCLPALPFKPLS